MSIVKVLNVGQGDSMILKHPDDCNCGEHEKTILIDLGPGDGGRNPKVGGIDYDITNRLNCNENLHIFLTHSHMDHINGFRFFWSNWSKLNRISEITVPCYHNQCVLIAEALLKLKGVQNLNPNSVIDTLKQILINQSFLAWMSKKKDIITYAYEGKPICEHITCLNPPKFYVPTDGYYYDYDRERFYRLADDLFMPEFAEKIKYFIKYGRPYKKYEDTDEDYWLEVKEKHSMEMKESRFRFVAHFFLENQEELQLFNWESTYGNYRKLYRNYCKYAHKACIVLKATFGEDTMLFTGDAERQVFERLIKEGKYQELSAEYLKMPHHGSKYNINLNILKTIHPKAAIISHGSRYHHPNKSTTDLLRQQNIEFYLTNDAIKKGQLPIYKKDNPPNNSFIEVE